MSYLLTGLCSISLVWLVVILEARRPEVDDDNDDGSYGNDNNDDGK